MDLIEEPTALPASAVPADAYAEALAEYCRTRGEAALYRASLLSQTFVQGGLGPEDIVALHCEALDKMIDGRPPREQLLATSDGHQFLLEVMIAYGVKYKEYLELKLSETLQEAEKRAAWERERGQEAERIGREKDEILAVIAHELRTPITAAKGTLDLAERSLVRGQMERLKPLLGSAREALDRLSRLSGDLVEASRGGAPTLTLQKLQLDAVLDQACRWAHPAAASKGVELKWTTPEEISLIGNSDALLSIFGNLLSNAVRYTPAGGRVTVRCGSTGDSAWVEVADTGIGMSPEVRGRVFEKFYRGPDARSLEAQGLGLGLALVQQFVDVHGGEVEVESEPGRGSTFRVVLPRGTSEK